MKQTLSREEKETLYRSKMAELQSRWGNRIDDDWNFIKAWSEKELDEGLADTIGQLRFEKGWSAARWIIAILVFVFVALGIIGLLLFGIKQLIAALQNGMFESAARPHQQPRTNRDAS